MVSAANGKSRYRGSNTKLSEVSAPTNTAMASTNPRIMVSADLVRTGRDPNSSRKVGSARSAIKAFSQNNAAATAAVSSAAQTSQPPRPELPQHTLSAATP